MPETTWASSRQEEPDETYSEYIHFETLFEFVIRRGFMERAVLKVRQKHMLLQSEEHSFLLADLDGVIYENVKMCVFDTKIDI